MNEFPNLVDHRYFYEEFVGPLGFRIRYTCGLARNAVAAGMRSKGVKAIAGNSYACEDIPFLSCPDEP